MTFLDWKEKGVNITKEEWFQNAPPEERPPIMTIKNLLLNGIVDLQSKLGMSFVIPSTDQSSPDGTMRLEKVTKLDVAAPDEERSLGQIPQLHQFTANDIKSLFLNADAFKFINQNYLNLDGTTIMFIIDAFKNPAYLPIDHMGADAGLEVSQTSWISSIDAATKKRWSGENARGAPHRIFDGTTNFMWPKANKDERYFRYLTQIAGINVLDQNAAYLIASEPQTTSTMLVSFADTLNQFQTQVIGSLQELNGQLGGDHSDSKKMIQVLHDLCQDPSVWLQIQNEAQNDISVECWAEVREKSNALCRTYQQMCKVKDDLFEMLGKDAKGDKTEGQHGSGVAFENFAAQKDQLDKMQSALLGTHKSTQPGLSSKQLTLDKRREEEIHPRVKNILLNSNDIICVNKKTHVASQIMCEGAPDWTCRQAAIEWNDEENSRLAVMNNVTGCPEFYLVEIKYDVPARDGGELRRPIIQLKNTADFYYPFGYLEGIDGATDAEDIVNLNHLMYGFIFAINDKEYIPILTVSVLENFCMTYISSATVATLDDNDSFKPEVARLAEFVRKNSKTLNFLTKYEKNIFGSIGISFIIFI